MLFQLSKPFPGDNFNSITINDKTNPEEQHFVNLTQDLYTRIRYGSRIDMSN